MGVSSVFYLHGLSVGGAFFSELTDLTPSINHDRLIGFASGHPEPLFAGLNAQAPVITFTTTAIKKVLDLCTTNTYGVAIASNIDLYYQAGTASDMRTSGASSAHWRFRATKGLLWWQSISATQGQPATITCTLSLLWDGTNAIIVPAGSQALAGTAVAAQYYTLGPVGISNVSLGGVTDWTLNSGCNVAVIPGDGDLWPQYASIRSAAPVLTGRALGDAGKSIAILGAAVTDLDLYLTNKLTSAGNVAKATETHISIAATAGHLTFDTITGRPNDPVSTAFQVSILAPSSAGVALTIDTTAAIGI